jgi:hypothetical protein
LRRLLLQVLQAILADTMTRERATELLGELHADDPNDTLEDTSLGDLSVANVRAAPPLGISYGLRVIDSMGRDS